MKFVSPISTAVTTYFWEKMQPLDLLTEAEPIGRKNRFQFWALEL